MQLSTGITLLNLALSERAKGGLDTGKYYLFVGDSASGKTLLCLSVLAEAVMRKEFAEHRLIYDNVEDGCMFDLRSMFNARVASRIEPPGWDRKDPVYSGTVEDFYYHVDDLCQQDRPFIYCLDSMDALTTRQSDEKFRHDKKAYRQGRETTGSYGDGKAKVNSEKLRQVVHRIARTSSILIIVSQTRDNLGFGWEKKTRSGGRALRFYATAELWMSVVKTLKRKIGEKEREIGVRAAVEVRKNRITGLRSEIEVDIYPSYGLDDLGSMVDYLVEEGVWGQVKGTIQADQLELAGSRNRLIRMIEERAMLPKVRSIVEAQWRGITEQMQLNRRKRY